jgi:UDP-N-acetyl-D-glucosamine dehydrogenase
MSPSDPHLSRWVVDEKAAGNADSAAVGTAVAPADLTILLQAHSAFDLEQIRRVARLLLDARGATVQAQSL